MDFRAHKDILSDIFAKIKNIEVAINPSKIKKEILSINNLEERDDFWKDMTHSNKIQKRKKHLINTISSYENLIKEAKDISELLEIAKTQNDGAMMQEVTSCIEELKCLATKLEISALLNQKDDSKDAILSIHPGAGGAESQDWALMLYRMYIRWAQRMGFNTQELDSQLADEAGIKSASFIIKGLNAYGYMKVEDGVHRLVRISPFDSSKRRHTSFCAIKVTPDVETDNTIELKDGDLKIDTYRASKAGGQHVNKTSSAVRLTHLPTNIVVQCQSDRSQHKNRANAIKILKSKLYKLKEDEKLKQQQSIQRDSIGWANQIRSYVLYPYRQVKDLRSGFIQFNVDDVLDGDIIKIIESVLTIRQK